jgi:hypothetical protein
MEILLKFNEIFVIERLGGSICGGAVLVRCRARNMLISAMREGFLIGNLLGILNVELVIFGHFLSNCHFGIFRIFITRCGNLYRILGEISVLVFLRELETRFKFRVMGVRGRLVWGRAE